MTSSNAHLRKLSREQALELPNEQKLAYFHAVVVKHTRMTDTLNDLLPLLNRHAGTDIVLLIGPTGVGKSATIAAAEDALLLKFQASLSDPSVVPVVSLEAPASGEHKFSWRILYTRFLDLLNEPLQDRKAATSVVDGQWRMNVTSGGPTVAALRVATEKALHHRQTHVAFVDEAAHLLSNCTEGRLISHMNALKSLSNVEGVTLVLAGSYDLYKLINLSGQLARRSAIIHMTRYRPDNKDDRASFRRVLRTLQNRLPIRDLPDLDPFCGQIEAACVGGIGILKDTLTRALSLALDRGGTWKHDYLRRSLLSKQQVAAILEETLEGEKNIESAVYGSRSPDDLTLA